MELRLQLTMFLSLVMLLDSALAQQLCNQVFKFNSFDFILTWQNTTDCIQRFNDAIVGCEGTIGENIEVALNASTNINVCSDHETKNLSLMLTDLQNKNVTGSKLLVFADCFRSQETVMHFCDNKTLTSEDLFLIIFAPTIIVLPIVAIIMMKCRATRRYPPLLTSEQNHRQLINASHNSLADLDAGKVFALPPQSRAPTPDF